jgi:hypothetical protein
VEIYHSTEVIMNNTHTKERANFSLYGKDAIRLIALADSLGLSAAGAVRWMMDRAEQATGNAVTQATPVLPLNPWRGSIADKPLLDYPSGVALCVDSMGRPYLRDQSGRRAMLKPESFK